MTISTKRFMTLSIVMVLIAMLGLSAYAPALAQDDEGDEGVYVVDAHAALMDRAGLQVGTVRFLAEEEFGTVAVLIQVNDVIPGFHQMYVTDAGECNVQADQPFGTAGQVFNPEGADLAGSAGMFPPILVMDNGTGAMTFRTDRFMVENLLDADGSAVVLEMGSPLVGAGGQAQPQGEEQQGQEQEMTPTPQGEEQQDQEQQMMQAQAGERLACGTIMEGGFEDALLEGEAEADEEGVVIEDDQPSDDVTDEEEGDDLADEIGEATEEIEEDLEDAQAAVEETADDLTDDDEDTAAEGAQMVEVGLTEFEINMPQSLPAGPATFEITNNGTAEHSFEIEGVAELEQNLQPGESATLEANLEPGSYRVYCPVDDHAEQGMEMTLEVTE